ncbi:MAG: cyclic nucleotide-binding domain-containing protein [Balneolaceae bacterium]|nr:cyclic nucleotide-binding domain-containing protein [Balneolaceae bacterium]
MFGSDKLKTFKKQTGIIARSRFLKSLTAMERYEFLQLCHSRSYKEDEYIYYQGDPGTGMYFIEEGRVQLVVESSEASDDDLTYDLEAPEDFGSLSIGYELRRMSSVRCLTDCTLLGFFKPDFETLKKRHPLIAVKFMETLAKIAMRQLEMFTDEVNHSSGVSKAFALRFESYYHNQLEA